MSTGEARIGSDPAAGASALVTGGSRGIGRAVARDIASGGGRVAVVARSREEVDLAARGINEALGREAAFPISGDVTDPSSVGRIVEAARRAAGEIDVLVNGAGAAESAPIGRTDDALLSRMLAVNLYGAHHMIAEILPSMTRLRRGAIVNIASTAALQGYAYASAYAASKHALLGLTRSVALETGRSGVRVNAVCPGFVDTPLLERGAAEIVARTGRTPDAARAALAKMNASGRLLTADEVAEAVMWLLAPAAADVNGQAIVVDGLARPWSGNAGLPVNPVALGEPRGYSHGMIFPPGRILFVAGQVAWDRDHRIVGGGDFAAQFDAALANVLSIVREAGGHPDRIGRLRIYVSDRDRYLASLKEVGAAYRRHMGAHYPAMALVEVSRLLESGALVEIEAEAIL
jgi:NAD(P)-dependent dehydrogenase (short-subunit alcohol dehydrogenase family)